MSVHNLMKSKETHWTIDLAEGQHIAFCCEMSMDKISKCPEYLGLHTLEQVSYTKLQNLTP